MAQIPSMPRLLKIDRLRKDGGTQCRASLDESLIDEFVGLMNEGVDFPPGRAWFDGDDYWLSDGFHRLSAAERVGADVFPVIVMNGTLADARWDACGANTTHGLRRTQEDVAVAVRRALEHPNSRTLSNVAIAKHLGLPEATFRRWRRRLSSPDGEVSVRVVERKGRTFEMDVSAIGKAVERGGETRVQKRNPICDNLEQLKGKTNDLGVRAVLNVFLNWASGATNDDRFMQQLEQLNGRTSMSKA